MDPFTSIAARVLYTERLTEAAQRKSRWGQSSPAPERAGRLWRRARTWLATLPFGHMGHRAADKNVAA